MTNIKSYTDLEQSKKLEEILPKESADMFWLVLGDTPRVHVLTESLSNYNRWENYPCWSLAALINILERGALFKTPEGWVYQTYVESKAITSYYYSNPIDACIEIILELHKQKLL